MFLAELQQRLEKHYDLHIPYCIEQFVSSDRKIANCLAEVQAQTGNVMPDVEDEVVFIHQSDNALEFTIYFDEGVLNAVHNSAADVDGLCTIVEGVSHGLCLLWHAHYDRQIRPVDLELQAEIDKFMILMGDNPDAAERRQLHHQLFTRARILASQGTPLHDRYRTANNLASRYCRWLDQRFLEEGDKEALDQELARFYRLSGRAKFDHIIRLH